MHNHIRYGICKYPANFDSFRKSLIMIVTRIIKIKIKINDAICCLNTKKTNDQKRFINS